MKRAAQKLNRDNRGSGVVAVLVAMLFISALGAALLFISYTGYQVKIAARRGTENFYNADTAMSEIRAGVQLAVTESLGTAYTSVLENYATLTGSYEGDAVDKDMYPTLDAYLESQFQQRFQTAFGAWQYTDAADGAAYPLIKDGSVNPDLLAHFISPDQRASVTLGSGAVTLVNSPADNRLLLRGVALSYKDERGYLTNLSADITVAYPPFSYTPAGQMLNGLNRYALIALGGLDCSAKSASLTGNANVGSLYVSNASVALGYSGGAMVCRGDAIITNSGSFSVVSTASVPAEFWAGDIALPAGQSSVTLSGSTYVRNDLTLDGSGASATLSGAYYGFGSSADDASQSSAILVNGRGTRLNMSGLNRLVLAGSSFIDATAPIGGGTYRMGQSVATRSDQLAYLVPKSCLPSGVTTNPCLVTNQFADYTAASVLGSLANAGSYYSYVSAVRIVYVPLTSSQWAAYFFMTFSSQTDANAFFAGYFADPQNASGITSYLKTYLAEYSAPASADSAGATYSGTVASLGLSGAADSVSAGYLNTFNSLWKTGTRSGSGSADDYYHAVVNETAINEKLAQGVTEFMVGADTAAVIARGDYTFSGGGINIIIATGNVTVNSNFTGIIISGGKVTMNGDIAAAPEEVSAALHASAAMGDGTQYAVLDFLNDGGAAGAASGSQSGISWDVDALVGYSNWKKY